GIEYAHQSYIVKIQAFGKHLCTDQNISFFVFKSINHFFQSKFSSGRILVHSGYFRVGKNMMKFHLNLLSTKTFGADIDAGTNVTMCRLGNRITAIMTFQHIISFVISQTDITVGALWYMPTAQAFHHGRKSTSVLK